ncbi:hypothetical protein IAR55_000496 [Kwoniella newhampshirensis]|uniref:PIG-P domain-containing protein n=1 Tax=Kwoniella newhampshirensis TaxID=1651941 RepID=A0AAW0Z6S9_9TREE
MSRSDSSSIKEAMSFTSDKEEEEVGDDSILPKITFAPPPLRPLSPTKLYLASACMGIISLLSALLGISFFFCPDHIWYIRPICHDTHYKYLFPLLVPVTAWFAIANWVGWEFFRYA